MHTHTHTSFNHMPNIKPRLETLKSHGTLLFLPMPTITHSLFAVARHCRRHRIVFVFVYLCVCMCVFVAKQTHTHTIIIKMNENFHNTNQQHWALNATIEYSITTQYYTRYIYESSWWKIEESTKQNKANGNEKHKKGIPAIHTHTHSYIKYDGFFTQISSFFLSVFLIYSYYLSFFCLLPCSLFPVFSFTDYYSSHALH